ncbi:phospholipase D-like domain-containing protein [Halomonas sp. V046]|uniref:phospholipase D-like domain-containing protein n=1 Tax=Halomonas sp. V046 TaxID=3459611 RepID=UPI00404397FB
MQGRTRNRHGRRSRRRWVWVKGAVAALLCAWGAMAVWQSVKPLPDTVGQAWPTRPQSLAADKLRFLSDRTWYDEDGNRHLDQRIFDEMLAMIGQAQRLVVVDMFLFNTLAGQGGEEIDDLRPLAAQLTDALVASRERHPELTAVVITDPLNTFYGGLRLDHLERLRQAGVEVVTTDLSRLRASNPLWSGLWHLGIDRLGNDADDGWLPNAFGGDSVTLRSYLSLLNFRANHRKTLVVDHGDAWAGLVTSANPHDGSSRHGNVALAFEGPVAVDLLASEAAVARWSGVEVALPGSGAEDGVGANEDADSAPANAATARLQLVTEGAIRDAILETLGAAEAGDTIDIAAFYVVHRGIIEALKAAAARGAEVRALLDPNREAFGFAKSGLPNQPVAEELVRAGVSVRWCVVDGEQCHSKVVLHRPASGAEATLVLGSANLTRRNLDDLNLETSLRLVAPQASAVVGQVSHWFNARWASPPDRQTSRAWAQDDASGVLARWRYRLMEATGLSTF